MVTLTVSNRMENVAAQRPSFRAFQILKFCFIAAPLIAGIDKFFNILVDWTKYLSPIVGNVVPPYAFMRLVGIVEIVAAGIVAVNPRVGAKIVTVWLWAIILNLSTIPGYFDVALRDFGLSLGALALSYLSGEYFYPSSSSSS